jgi:CheY-like chemotaxis protein
VRGKIAETWGPRANFMATSGGEQAAPSRRFTILFVEDDSEVRDSVVEVLRVHGFDVLVAADGYEAIRLLVEFPVDLMFTDVVMPGLTGFELAEQAKLIRPDLRVLYMTGYAERPQDRKRMRYGKVLQKPMRADELTAEIRAALAN